MLVTIFCYAIFIISTRGESNARTEDPYDWKVIEQLAEQHPYVVALLDKAKEYICSGTTIGRRTVLTSGYCTTSNPKYIAAGLAAYNSKYSTKNIVPVSKTRLHEDYYFVLNPALNTTQVHSSIGLVFAARPYLDIFLPPAKVGSYYAAELKDVELTSIGYGKAQEGNVVVLQAKFYDQTPCTNPRWYYCVCGTEIGSYGPRMPPYNTNFGNGAPAIYQNIVVGIAVTSSEKFVLASTGVKFNIFTVIGPYIPWIEKTENINTAVFRAMEKGRNTCSPHIVIHHVVFVCFVLILQTI